MYHFLINGCPVLEELSLHYHEDLNPRTGVVVSCVLQIYHYFPSHRKAHDDVLFDTPNLVYLDYSSYVADKYEVYLGSLVEARLIMMVM
uniref:F-box/LRR-repeat protein n=1 Tax=Noccaea caerulescens TaxID=107243 RepID=A0A1J3CD33_NOCCA